MKRLMAIFLAALMLLLVFPTAALAEGTYTVTFTDGQGATLKTETVDEGGDATAPTEPTREGYTFDGWDVDFTNVTANLTVTAQWTENTPATKHTVTFVDPFGKVLKKEEVEDGADATPPENPKVQYFIFDGWNENYTNVTEDREVFAYWTYIDPTVSFEGTKDGTKTIKYDGKDHKLSVDSDKCKVSDYSIKVRINEETEQDWDKVVLTKPGTYKIHWCSDYIGEDMDDNISYGGAEEGFTVVIEEDAKLTATGGTFTEDGTEHKVEAKVENNYYNYTIQYKVGDTAWTETAPSLKEEGKVTVKVQAVSEDTSTVLTCDDAVLEVIKATTFTVTFDSDGGSAVEKQTVNENEKATKPADPTKDGYTFKEWQKDGKAYDFNTAVTADITLKAVWETTKAIKTVTIVNCNTAVNVRKGASSSTTKLGLAKKGAVYELLGKEKDGKWYKIQYTKDQVGYVWHEYVEEGTATVGADDTTTSSEETGKIVTIVNCKENCNVRKGGSVKTTKLGTAPKDATYTYLGTSGSYYKIQWKDDTVGYVHKKYAKVSGGTASGEPASTGKIVKINKLDAWCNVRAGASTKYAKLGTAKKNQTFQYLGKSGNWYKIQYTDKTQAWVYSKFATLTTGTATPEKESESTTAGGSVATVVGVKNRVNVRQKASSSSKLLGTVALGGKVTVVQTLGDWTKVKFNDQDAYIFSKYLKADK